jgi:hypothetical protein
MRSRKFDMLQSRLNPAKLMLRLMLRHDELFRLPVTSRGVQVVSGQAWLTMDGEDIFLRKGEKFCLLTGKDSVLVSALGHAPLILEVLGDSASTLPGRLIAPQPG